MAVVQIGVEVLKFFIIGKFIKRTVADSVDTAFTSVIRSMMKYRLDAKTVFGKQGREETENDEMSDLR